MIPKDIQELIARGGGVLLRGDAERAGLATSRIYPLIASGALTTVMPGCFARASHVAKLDAWGRFALAGRAFALSHDAFLTGWAAAMLCKLPTVGRPPARPTAIRPKAPGRGSQNLKHGRLLVADIPEQHRYRRGQLRVTSPAWSVADVVRTTRLPDGLVVADAAARNNIELGALVSLMNRWPGIAKLRWVAEYAEPNAETPIESLGRFTFYEYDFPLPVANAWVGWDRPEWRVDGLLPWHWWVKEGDGAVKYNNRSDASDIVRKQNDREYALRRLGLEVLRYRWDDVYHRRGDFARKIRAMFRERPPRKEPVRWWKEVPGVGPVEPKPEDWPSPHPTRIVLPVGWRDDLRDS